MYMIIANIIVFILIIMSYEKNVLKYGIFIGLVYSTLQGLSLGNITYVGIVPYIIMLVGYSVIASVIKIMLQNMDSRLKYVIIYDLCFNIIAYLFYRFIVMNVVLMFS